MLVYKYFVLDTGKEIRDFMFANMADHTQYGEWQDLSLDFTTFYDNIESYRTLSRFEHVWTDFMVFLIGMKIICLGVQGMPSLATLCSRISINLITFGVLMLFITGSNFFLLRAAYGDYLEAASTELLSFEFAFLIYIGSYDFESMSKIDPVSTYFVATYILFFPLLIYNLSISVMVVELPLVERQLHNTDKYVALNFSHKRPIILTSLKSSRVCGGQRRLCCCRVNPRGVCACMKIEGNADVENPFIWFVHFSRRKRRDGGLVRHSTWDIFTKRFLTGKRIDVDF
jgi:hypothetical protein